MRKAVCLLVKDLPCDLTAIVVGAARLDQLVFLPCHAARLDHGRIELDQRGIVSVKRGIALQNINNRHMYIVLSCCTTGKSGRFSYFNTKKRESQ